MKISEDRKVIYANGLAGRVNIVKVTILPKAILRFNAISIKIPIQFFIDLERAICNFHQTNRKHRRGENVLNTKKKFWQNHHPWPLSILQSNCDKICMVLVSERHVDHWNRIEDPGRMPHTYGHLIFHKGAKIIQWEKTVLSWNVAASTSDCYVEECKSIQSYPFV